MSTLKLIGCVALVIGCFAVLYPRFMHPLVLRLFGLHKTRSDNDVPSHPPGIGRPGMPRPKSEEIKKTTSVPTAGDPRPMRPGPHPGMRAAVEMNKQQSQGSGRGMMGVVLPMYAVGIIVYLVYTLIKVFNKRSEYKGRPYGQYWQSDNSSAFHMEKPPDPKTMQENDVQKLLSGVSPGKDLEELLLRVDDENVTASEMRELQKRLEETEAQMHRILTAMQNVQQKVSSVLPEESVPSAGDAAAASAPDSSTEPAEQPGNGTTSDRTPETPDTESYEVVKNVSSSSDASPFTELPSEPLPFPETIAAAVSSTDDAGTKETVERVDAEEEVEDVVLSDRTSKAEEEEDGVRHRKPVAPE